MRSALVTCALVIPMLMHGLFGCCWHHEICWQAADTDTHESDVCHGRHGHADCGRSEEHDSVIEDECDSELPLHSMPHRHSCPGTRCDYVSSSRVRAVHPVATSTGVLQLCVPDVDTLVTRAAATAAVSRNMTPPMGTRALRAHILCCVWLI